MSNTFISYIFVAIFLSLIKNEQQNINSMHILHSAFYVILMRSMPWNLLSVGTDFVWSFWFRGHCLLSFPLTCHHLLEKRTVVRIAFITCLSVSLSWFSCTSGGGADRTVYCVITFRSTVQGNHCKDKCSS